MANEWSILKDKRQGCTTFAYLTGETIRVVLPKYNIDDTYKVESIIRHRPLTYSIRCISCGTEQFASHELLTHDLFVENSTRVLQCLGCQEKARREQGVGERTQESAISIDSRQMVKRVNQY
jgi:hypothetical protein